MEEFSFRYPAEGGFQHVCVHNTMLGYNVENLDL
jgi:hypothetical protein